LIASISQRLSKPVRRVGMISSRVATVESARPIDFNRRYATGVAILATLPALKDRPKLKWSLRDRKPRTHISNNFGNNNPDGRATDTSNSIGENTMQVGLIGLGIMGAPMARNLLKAGFALTVATRTPGKAEKFAAENSSLGDMKAANTPAEVAAVSKIIVTM